MATGEQLWELSQARLKTVKTLLNASDFEAAGYMMGYALETALKAASCKALKLSKFPDGTGNKHISNCFMSHNFDQLLVISGFSSDFEASGPVELSGKWSEFLQFYPPNWVTMRYDPETLIQFNSITTARLYEILYENESSIIKTIRMTQKW